jgi:hypothetical protein
MRLVFVSHVHPDTGLIAGLRLWRFAQELAKRGHRVLFITERIEPTTIEPTGNLTGRLNSHDWSSPMLLTCGEPDSSHRHRLRRTAAGRSIVSKAATAADIVVRGGVFWRWRQAIQREYMAFVSAFRPELIYATFGNLDALRAAADLARHAGVPWVMDVKDPLPAFVPRALWWLARRRCSSAAAVTFNSEFQRSASGSLLRRPGNVIYSGADVAALNGATSSQAAAADRAFFTLIGSVYSDDDARDLLTSFAGFAEGQRVRGLTAPELRYYGGDHERVRALVSQIGNPGYILVSDSVPRPQMLALCRIAIANCYLATKRTFHHKLFELLAAGRPVIAYPREWDESVSLARNAGAKLEVCATAAELVDAWSRYTSDLELARPVEIRGALGWPRFVVELEALFESLVTPRVPCRPERRRAVHRGANADIGNDS